jgi:hypothetical protein
MFFCVVWNLLTIQITVFTDLAWGLLMDSQFEDLLEAICGTDEEFVRFRQLVVNSVMATDIADKDLKQLRNARWDRAFSDSVSEGVQESKADSVNRKATIVIEHLIQASDVAHTMQHWYVVSHLFQIYCSILPFCYPLISVQFISWQFFSGTFTANGMSDCSWRCMLRTRLAELKLILQSSGIKVRLGSLTFTLFLWPKS